jgi:hypothetical protein
LYSAGQNGVDDAGQAEQWKDHIFPVKRVVPGKETRSGP